MSREGASSLRGDRLITPDGSYLLRRLLGEGASARVYLAQRDDPELPLAVAVKILRRRRGAAERLRRERGSLSRLDHPHIARMLGAGETEDGQSFLILEYVPGEPIDDFCNGRHLDIRRRLALVTDVCTAVEHGHRALVLHRDIKPSNVLVTDDGVVKVVDFGIAALDREGPPSDLEVEDDTGDDAEHLVAGAFSPGFASPEQVAGRPLTTSSDVYGLGALLHRLLVGRPPYDSRGLSPADLELRLQERMPSPRQVLEAAERGAPSPDLPPDLRPAEARLPRDLDAVLQKALAPDTEQRYAGVAALAEDLRRYAAGLPVSARPPTTSYRFTKWLERHRRGAAAAALAAASLIFLTALLWHVSGRLAEERDRARNQEVQADATFDFLAETLSRADSSGREKSVQELLQEAEADLPAGPPTDTATSRRLWILGRAGHGFGDPEGAAGLYRRALLGLERSRARSHVDGDLSLESMVHLNLASALIDLDAYDDAEHEIAAARRLAHDVAAEASSTSRDLLLIADSLLGSLLYRRGDVEQADRMLTPVLPRLSTLWALGSGQRIETERIWALAQIDLGRYDDALPIYRAHLDQAIQNRAPTVHLLQASHHLGTAEFLAGRFPEAHRTLQQAVSLLDQVGEDGLVAGPLTAIAALNAIEIGDLEEAADLARRSLEIRSRLFGEESRHVGFAWSVVGRVDVARGRRADAEASFRRSADVLQQALPDNHPFQAVPLTGLGNLWVDGDRAADAEPLLRRAAQLRESGFGPSNHETAQSRLDLAVCLAQLGHDEEAEATWTAGAQVLTPTRRQDVAMRRVCTHRPAEELCRRFTAPTD